MKALFCSYCHTIAGLPGDCSIVECRCRPTGLKMPGAGRGRCRGRWVDPGRGLAIFTEVAQGGAERDDLAESIDLRICRVCKRDAEESHSGSRWCSDCGSGWSNPFSRTHERGTAISAPRALSFLGIHNAVLEPRPRYDAWRYATGSLFIERESMVIKCRPGESCDTAYVSVEEFDRGEWPETRLDHLPAEKRVYDRRTIEALELVGGGS